MKYIKKIILENFQSHKYTEIELDKYLNVIVGPSDHGKTAIIRGIKWALFNEPSGDFFIREGENECSVTVIFNDGTKIKRYRSKSKNAYYVYNNEGEEIIFEGFGTKVPQEVVDKTSMRKIILDSNQSNSINIGEQLEGPFLLSEKNATRANAIGRLVGVHIIDDALKDTLKDIRNLNIKRRNREESLEKLKDSLAEYDYLDDLVIKVEKLKIIKNHINNKQQRLGKLIQLLEGLNEVDKEIFLLKEDLSKLEDINVIEDIEKELVYKINGFNHIFTRYNRLVKLTNDIEYNKDLLVSLKDLDRVKEMVRIVIISLDRATKLNKINLNINRMNNLITKNNKVLDDLQEIEKVDDRVVTIDKLYSKLNKLLNLKNKLDNVNKSLSIGKIYIKKLSEVDSISEIKDILELKNRQLSKWIDYKKKYDTILINKSEIEKNLLLIDNEIDIQLQKYKKILDKLEVCPLCFSNIDKLRIDEIINNYR